MNKTWDKKLFKDLAKDQFYDIDTLKDKFGLNTESEWYEALDELGDRDVKKILKLIESGEDQKNPDDTHRLFYVACTRTENNLYIIEPQTKKAYDI